jgi:uncharacterized protein (TIGR02001 family)
MKKSIVLATAVASVLASGVASAEVTANAGVFSNYIWRGVTQTSDNAAGQGGIDWSGESGLYAGTWLSTITNGQELDIYAGFAGEAGGLGYDLGAITYQYPLSPEINFTEVYVSGTMSIVTIGLAYTVDAAAGNDGGAFDSGDMYVNGSLDFTVGKSDVDVSVYGGSYMFENDSSTNPLDYNHFGASIGKDGFAFAADKNDIEGGNADNVRFTVSYSKDFEL